MARRKLRSIASLAPSQLRRLGPKRPRTRRIRRCTQGRARFQRCFALGCIFALSALLPPSRDEIATAVRGLQQRQERRSSFLLSRTNRTDRPSCYRGRWTDRRIRRIQMIDRSDRPIGPIGRWQGATLRSIASLAPVSCADWGQRARNTDVGRRCTQGGARFQRCLPWAAMFAPFSAAAVRAMKCHGVVWSSAERGGRSSFCYRERIGRIGRIGRSSIDQSDHRSVGSSFWYRDRSDGSDGSEGSSI